MNLIRNLILSLVVGMAAIGLTLASAAAALLPPIGLSAGDQYRIAFVTSATTDALSSDITYYNNFVTTVANSNPDLAALGTTWAAIASTATVDALDNTDTNPWLSTGVGIYNTFGQIVAYNNADLWDEFLTYPIHYNEYGIFQSSTVWTGTTRFGYSLPLFSLGESGIGVGQSTFFTDGWIQSSRQIEFIPFPLYAISGALTVPSVVPLPAALPLYGAGLAVMGFIGWRRKRKTQATA